MEESRSLHRGLGLWTASLAVIGSVIGSGVFKKAGPMAAELHSSSLVLVAWVLAGLVTLAGALSNLEVAGLIAEPGGWCVGRKAARPAGCGAVPVVGP